LHCDTDYAIFIYNHITLEGVRTICIIAWHIDNGLAGSNNHKFLNWVKLQLTNHFGLTDFGAVTKYLGVKIEHDWKSHELWMHQ
ncbi:hypothetical protein PAXINDRAFT_39372, partial [Paxillus involutus ATCC 200175]